MTVAVYSETRWYLRKVLLVVLVEAYAVRFREKVLHCSQSVLNLQFAITYSTLVQRVPYIERRLKIMLVLEACAVRQGRPSIKEIFTVFPRRPSNKSSFLPETMAEPVVLDTQQSSLKMVVLVGVCAVRQGRRRQAENQRQ